MYISVKRLLIEEVGEQIFDICTLVGYDFEIFKIKSRDIVLNILLLSIRGPLFKMFRHFNFLGLNNMSSSYTPDYGMVMATLSTTLVFFLMQKQFVEGMLGSVKG